MATDVERHMSSLTRLHARPQTPLGRSVWHTARDWWGAVLERRRQRLALARLSDALLRDIGISRDEARTAVFEFIEIWYNRERLHSSLGYLSPVAYEQQLETTRAA